MDMYEIGAKAFFGKKGAKTFFRQVFPTPSLGT